MTIALWALNIILAVAFLGAGFMKATTPKHTLKERAGMGWTDQFSATTIRLIGVAEIVGAVGLIAPMATKIAPVLTPVAAVALAVTMVLAVIVHARRSEVATPAISLGVLSIASAVLGFIVLT